MNSATYFIENLTLRAWVLSIWPRLLRERFTRGTRPGRCYVIDSSAPALLVAQASAVLAGVEVKRLPFSLVDIRDEDGTQVRLRIAYKELAEVQREAMAEPAFRQVLESGQLKDRMPMFLAKSLADSPLFEWDSMIRSLLLVEVCAWQSQREAEKDEGAVLFLQRRPWSRSIAGYASRRGVTAVPVSPALEPAASLRRRLPHSLIEFLRLLRYSGLERPSQSSIAHSPSQPSSRNGISPRVLVEYQGQLNLDQPERHSDLFFWQRSDLEGKDVMVSFGSPSDPLDEPKWAELKEHGMAAVALHPGATSTGAVPVFAPRNKSTQHPTYALPHLGREARWLREQIGSYSDMIHYWANLFDAHNIKIHVTWHKNGPAHCAIADAIRKVGGISAIYQRSYESHSSPITTVGADVVFGFSQESARIERDSGSDVRYHVTTGYLGDHRFPLLDGAARAVRARLHSHGATHILAYFDENTVDDARWFTGHSFMQHDYSFLLDKLLADPTLGLLIKPKTPRTLRQRLGPVADMLQEAQTTGRCYVYEEGTNQGSHPPAAAALAADLAVHGHLYAASAGIDAALAGVPTLLLDREGWPASPFYKLGMGRVVFTQWEDLWEAWERHRSARGPVTGLGDWSSMLGQLDPFRDGRAAERMGTYIHWLLEDFGAGRDREKVMADAAERYCAMWGNDKVTEISGGLVQLGRDRHSADGLTNLDVDKSKVRS